MKQGEVLQKGTPEDIYVKPSHEFVAKFVGKANWLVENKQMVRPEHVNWAKMKCAIRIQVKFSTLHM